MLAIDSQFSVTVRTRPHAIWTYAIKLSYKVDRELGRGDRGGLGARSAPEARKGEEREEGSQRAERKSEARKRPARSAA